MALMRPSRRTLLTGLASAALLPLPVWATPEEMREALDAFTAGRPVQDGRVTLDLPPIAENGNSVSLDVEVDSPMTDTNHVRSIAIFAEANPLPDVARFSLTPMSGRARVATRIRLNDTQTILAVAEMSDGTLWSGAAQTVVTLAACGIIL